MYKISSETVFCSLKGVFLICNTQFANHELETMMKKHNGMRPLDILILVQIALFRNKHWLAKELSNKLKISASEVSESLNRSAIGGLLSSDKRNIMRKALLEFLEFGLKYTFPQRPGPLVRGIPTAHSAPPLKGSLNAEESFVWPYHEGILRGQSIEPLYKTVPEISLQDDRLYEVLALIDSIRVGKIREQKLAMKELKRRIIEL